MKKIVCLFLAVSLSVAGLYAQEAKRIEGEIGIGYPWVTGKYDGLQQHGGVAFSAELRYKLPYQPIDLGVRASVTRLIRKVDRSIEMFDPYLRDDVLAIEATGDYKFNNGGNTTLLVGCRLGYAWFDSVNPELEVDTMDQTVTAVYGEKGNGVVFSPRIGVQMFRWRLTCSYTIANKYNSHMMIGVGVVIGGGKRQKTDRITFD